MSNKTEKNRQLSDGGRGATTRGVADTSPGWIYAATTATGSSLAAAGGGLRVANEGGCCGFLLLPGVVLV